MTKNRLFALLAAALFIYAGIKIVLGYGIGLPGVSYKSLGEHTNFVASVFFIGAGYFLYLGIFKCRK